MTRSRWTIHPQSSPETLADAVAKQWFATLPSAPRPYSVGLSGGRIAAAFFQSLARLSQTAPSPLQGVHFFWADERAVPPDHEDSNFLLAQKHLIKPLKIPDSCLHRIRGELSPAQAAEAACAELRRVVPPTDAEGQDSAIPRLDCVFLGMGEDGHVASLFPDGPRPEDVTDLFVSVVAAKPPPLRVSMSYALLQAAKHVIVLASGQGKEPALRRSLEPSSDTPLGRLLRLRFHTDIYTDLALPKTKS